MKRILIIMHAVAFALLVASTSSYAQRTFKVVINESPYNISETDMNDCFADAFNKMLTNGVTKEKHFELWVKTYNAWKDYHVDGEQIFQTMGERITDNRFSKVIPNAFMGMKPNESGGNGSPHKKDNTAMRVAMLNYYFPPFLILKLTGKTVK